MLKSFLGVGSEKFASVSGRIFDVLLLEINERRGNGTLAIFSWYFLIKFTLHTSHFTRIC